LPFTLPFGSIQYVPEAAPGLAARMASQLASADSGAPPAVEPLAPSDV